MSPLSLLTKVTKVLNLNLLKVVPHVLKLFGTFDG